MAAGRSSKAALGIGPSSPTIPPKRNRRPKEIGATRRREVLKKSNRIRTKLKPTQNDWNLLRKRKWRKQPQRFLARIWNEK